MATKGNKINTQVTIHKTYSANVGAHSMETLHIVFIDASGNKYLWRTNDHDELFDCEGITGNLEAFVYDLDMSNLRETIIIKVLKKVRFVRD